jgi:hypothetical protein
MPKPPSILHIFILLIHGIIIALPMTIFAVMSSLFIVLRWTPINMYTTVLSIWKTRLWGIGLKIMAIVLAPIVIIITALLIIIVSPMAGLIYGLIGPGIRHQIYYHDFCHAALGKYIPLFFMDIRNSIDDVWYINEIYQDILNNFRISTPSKGVLNIPLGKSLMIFLLFIIIGFWSMVMFTIIAIVFNIPVIVMSMMKFTRNYCCCITSIKSCAICCVLPLLCIYLILQIAAFIMIPLAPLYAIIKTIHALKHAANDGYEHGFLCMWETIRIIWYDALSIICRRQFEYVVIYNTTSILNKNSESNTDQIPIREIWLNFLDLVPGFLHQAITKGLIEFDDVRSKRSYLLVTIPAYIILHLIANSTKDAGITITMHNGMIITEATHPRNWMGNYVWSKMIDLRQTYSAGNVSLREFEYLESRLITANNPSKMGKFDIPLSRQEHLNNITAKFQKIGLYISRIPSAQRHFNHIFEMSTEHIPQV